MNFQELTELRCSVRSFTDEPVSDDDLNYILNCARMAPSAVNYQPWHFYVVASKSMHERLQSCYEREWFRTAPLYIICTLRHEEAWVRKSDGKEHGNIDVAIAAEHICLAAADRGLGSCWVCNFDAARCHELLHIPVKEEVVAIIPIGHFAASTESAPKKRKALDEVVTWI